MRCIIHFACYRSTQFDSSPHHFQSRDLRLFNVSIIKDFESNGYNLH